MADESRRVTALPADKLRRLMSRLTERQGTAAEIPRAERDGPLPVSFAQERLWFLDRLGAGGAAYHVPAAVHLCGPLDAAALERTLGALVDRHEALRTTFSEEDGRPVQTVHAAALLTLPRVDLAALPEALRADESARISKEEAGRPFDLARGPLLRAVLVRLGSGDHLLALTFHHIVTDGWSLGVLVREVAALYPGIAAGAPAELPELPIQPADHAVWEREHLRGEALEGALAFWREHLADLPPLELPADRSRPATPSFRGALATLDLPTETARSLEALAQREKATPFMVLLALFQALLLRTTGQSDFGVGTPVARRTRGEVEGLIGLFVNTLVLRAGLAGEPGFTELVRRTREATLAAFAHEELPFEKLVEELRPEREPGRNPLFQVLFTVQNQPWPKLRVGDLDLELSEIDTGTARADLTLIWRERDGGLAGTLEYSTDLFERASAERLLGHLAALLDGALADPERGIRDLPLLADAERRQILEEWRGSATPYPREATVHELFAEQAAQAGGRVAVESAEARLTYAELEARANQLAHHLRRLGVGPDCLVGLAVPRSPDTVAGLLGILEAGGAYLPLDPAWPRERLATLVAEARPRALVTLEPLLDRFPGGMPVVCLDRDREALAAEPRSAPAGGATAGSLAYVLYTSGSTGEPKGVAVPHRGVVRLVRGAGFARLDAGQTFLQLAPLSFDASTLEIWGALCNGGRLVLAPPEPPSLIELGRLLTRHGVTTLWLTAGLFHQMVDEGIDALRELSQLLAGGDVLSPAHVRRAVAALPGCTLINGYGPTENTTFTCCHPLTEARADAPVPIGRPIGNTTVVVLDRAGRPAPVGVPGELLTGGDGLARGYLGRPDLTAERFIPDPLFAGERLYRTGDLVRWRPDGTLDFLRRIDRQVKIRGFRIEPGEIEAVLADHPGVAACAVVVQGAGEDRRLIAWIVPREGAAPEPDGLRAWLAGRLPAWMVPAAFALLDALPLTANGKVDRRALARREPPAAEARGSAPETPLEHRIAAIWSDLLGPPRIGRIGRDDDFFALGGHSLLATRVVSRLREELGLELPLVTVFENPTLAGLAAAVEQAAGSTPDDGPVPAAAGEDEAPLSFAQERLWFLEQLRPGGAYNVPAAVRLAGGLDPAVLAACFGEIVRRHATLRTTFASVRGEPRQRVAPPAGVPLPLVDLTALPQEARDHEARRRTTADAAAPFDLATGPLLRTTLLRLGTDEHRLLLTLHHIAADGWSAGILVRETAALYAAFAAGRPSPLPDLPVQYADFALWQRRRLAGATLDAELRFWSERLHGAPPELALPGDRPRPALVSGRGVSWPLHLAPALAEGVRALALRAGATPFMVLLTAFETLLARLSGQTDLTAGTPVAGRQRAEVEGLIGCFVNTLVLRADLAGEPAFADLLARTRRHALEAWAHQELPFEKLVEQLQPGRDLAQTPLFQAFFVLQNAPAEPLCLPGLTVELLPEETGTAKFDLTLALAEAGGALTGGADLFDAATIERWAGCFEQLLAAAIQTPEESVFALPLLREAERRTILVEWSSARWELPTPALIHELFAEQAARTPGKTAAVRGGEVLSYRELDGWAGRVARRLGAFEDRALVGLMAAPDLPLLAGMLGILKAGSGFVPLDPDLPAERLERMIADCGLTVIAADRRSFERCPAVPHLICLDGGMEDPDLPPLAAGAGDGTAYVIFTSGSTGVPKGVPISHENLVPLLLWSREVFGFGEHTRVLQSLSYAFDFGVFEILTTLLFGGTLFLRGGAGRADLESYLREARELEINTLHTTPSFFRAVAAEAGAAGLPALRVLHLGGEALTEALVAEAFAVTGPECRLFNGYGPTEAAVNCALFEVGSAGDWHPRGLASLPIGHPSAENRLYVLDRRLRPVPAGVHGELLAGGPALSRGYLGRPDLTAARFVPDPFGELGGRLYRTGDLVRFHADGAIEFLGRADHQVKIRGYRIELEEIEAGLAAHPEVGACAVIAQSQGGEARLVAYVAARPETDVAELRRFLGRTLPAYMVPAAFVVLPELPLNPSGKVDRKALPAPGGTAAAGWDAPRTPIEQRIAAVWSELLGREQIGRGDNFFSLGGHSLLATRVVSRLREEIGIELPVLALFEAPTVAGLAARVQEASPAEGPIPAADEAVLSFAQERLWFLEQLRPGGAAYNVPAAVRLAGALDPAVLAACFGEIARRHATLRTTFLAVDGAPRPRVAPAAGVPLPLVDLAALPEESRLREARHRAAMDALAPFGLEAGPLLRTTLLRLAAEEHRLLLTLHHIVADGWSAGILVRETAALYAAFAAGRPSPLPELPVQYADFALWQRRRLAGQALDGELRFWSDYLHGAPPELALPTDHPRPALRSERGVSHPLRLGLPLAEGVRALALQAGATPFMVLLAAFATLLSRLSGQTDLTVGTPVAGRPRAEVESLIGFFVNTLVLRAGLADVPSFAALLADTRRHALEAYAHQELPFEKLVEHLQPGRHPGQTPLFQAFFALQNAPAEPLHLPGLAAELLPGETGTAKFDLTLTLAEDGDGLTGELTGSAGLFEPATIERWAGHFERLLTAALPSPEESVLALPLLGETAGHQIIEKAVPSTRGGGAPATPLERRIAAVWSDLLGQPRIGRIGRDDDFFALGGHSLLATRVVSRLRAELGVELPVLALFEAPTPAGLAAILERTEDARSAGEPIPAAAEAVLSFSQERLWFLEQLRPGGATYNIPAAVRLTGPLDPVMLAACLGEIVRRHETLRTTFPATGGAPRLHVAPAGPVHLPLLDLAALPEATRDLEGRRLAAAEAAAPFDLAAGPLLRATLLRLGADEHLLLLTAHHIVADGWSVGLLISEMGALSAAFAAGRPAPLPELPIQYADFALWQRLRLRGTRLERELRFWGGRLRDAPAELALPTDRPRPAVPGEQGASRRLCLSAELARGVRALALRTGATPFMVLLAAFETLLSRLSGQDDLTMGTPVAGRERAEVEHLIGFFVNTLVLRADLADGPAFAGLLARTRRHALEAYSHQELPFEKLVEHLQPGRDAGHSPLFQAFFALQNGPAETLCLPGLAVELLPVSNATAKFDLTLALAADGEGFAGELSGRADLLDAATIERWAGHFERLLAAAIQTPGESVFELPLLAEAERRAILGEWSSAGWELPAPVLIHRLFAEQAARAPGKIAASCRGETLTYRELDERSGRLAGRLAGCGQHGLVGLMAAADLPLLAGMLGILKAGSGFVPLDPGLPAERLERMAAGCGLKVIAADRRSLAQCPAVEHLVCLDDEPAPDLPPGTAGAGDGTAYVIFTSGSTGEPKGVPITHENLVPLLLWSREVFGFGEHTRVLQSLSHAFDFGVFEILTTLLFGGTLFLRGEAERGDLPGYLREARDHAVDTLHTTPSFFRAIAAAAGTAGLPALRVLHLGGEALTEGLVAEAFAAAGPECRVFNGYGPTEAAVNCALFAVGSAAEWHPRGLSSLPIGHPSAANRLYVLDRRLHPVPAGVSGELLVGGVALSRGYLGRPGLTAARFIPDPFGEPGGRLYRTGDLVRFHTDGAIEFLGRVDHQVKIRGYRIELEEIEAALAAHPEVGACAVVAVRQEGEPRLVAYVAARREAAVSPGELRCHLGGTLPAYMVPAAFVVLPELPWNASGKVDRKALARRELPAAEARGGAPETQVELQIAAVWSDLLRQPRIGRDDDFFALGGHSLLATQAVSRLRDRLGVEIPVRDFFEQRTLADLARRIEAVLRTEGPAAARTIPVLGPAERAGRLPLSFAQERLWFLEQLEPGSAFYNIPLASHLAGPLRIGALRQGIAALVRRHESLRTTFGDVQGKPFQAVAATASGDIPLIDLAGLPGPLRDAELRRQIAEESRRPFDLARGPLFRIPLFRLGTEEHVLVPTMHHIISDGWSMTVLLREIAAFYDAFSAGRTPDLPALPVQYADYAVWQRGDLQGAALEARLAWWRERLTGVPGLQLPTDRPRPPVETFRGRQRPVALDAGRTRRLHELANREGATLFMTLLAVFQTLLLRVTGQTDLPVGSPIANRYRSEVEGVIGFFANTLVLRTDLSGNPSFRELLRRVREVTLGAYAHEDVPFEKLVGELQPERDMSRNPLFQVMCVLQNQPWPEAPMGEVRITSLPVDSGTAKFDLTLFWREDAGILSGLLEHNTDLFDDPTARRLYRHHEALLAAALDDPEARIGALPLLDAAERHQVLREWNEERGDGVWAGRSVHTQVEEQAARTPGALAVIDEGRTLSYAELDARANRLARGLARRGVRPETLVGICVERSLEMVVAALAVLKAGGALVALDPAYPRERLAAIIDDARLAMLLTQAALLQHFPEHQGIAFCMEREDDPFPEESTASPGVAVDPDHPIYAIYTSGSTGQPKGIVVTHRAFSNLLAWQLGDPGLRPGGRTVQFATFGFCVSFQEMLSSWSSGGTLVLADEMTRRDLPRLAAFLEEQEIDRLHLPFAALKHLAEAAADQRLPARLRTVITAGEQLQVTPAVRSLFDRLPGCTLANQYGASETHVVTALTLAGDPARWPAIPPVGRPVDRVAVHLLDARMEPVPLGVAGELYAGGACPPRCYLNDPALTAAKLVPDPFGGVPGARLYRTGDAARYLADGRIEYHGRIDTQVKIRGFRVELGEIETVLARHGGVRDAAVVARPGHDGQRLVAYVVAAGEDGSLFDELRTLLKQKLPEHMLPSAFVEMPALPVNANGKLDQAALPEPEIGNAREKDYVAPRTPVEELIAGIWAEVLGVERVGICSDFFELGGHSLLATQVVARVRQALGVDLGVRSLFEARTVEELTLTVAEKLLDQADAAAALAAFAAAAEGEGADG